MTEAKAIDELRAELIELILAALDQHGAGASVEISRRESHSFIAVRPHNPSSACLMVHLESPYIIDIEIGRAMRFEIDIDDQSRSRVMAEVASLVNGVIEGQVKERVRIHKGAIGSTKGVVITAHGPIRTAVYDSGVGWIFGRTTDIEYQRYTDGSVEIMGSAN